MPTTSVMAGTLANRLAAPATRPTASAAPKASVSPASHTAPHAPTKPSLGADHHAGVSPETVTVRAGESLSSIAARYQIPMSQIKELNPQLFTNDQSGGLKRVASGSLIYPGDQVRLRAKAAASAAPAATTTPFSAGVIKVAKAQIDHAVSLAFGHDAQIDPSSVKQALGKIPASDPDYARYAEKANVAGQQYLKATASGTHDAAKIEDALSLVPISDPEYGKIQALGRTELAAVPPPPTADKVVPPQEISV